MKIKFEAYQGRHPTYNRTYTKLKFRPYMKYGEWDYSIISYYSSTSVRTANHCSFGSFFGYQLHKGIRRRTYKNDNKDYRILFIANGQILTYKNLRFSEIEYIKDTVNIFINT